jgi:hypothetical protein
LDFKEDQLAIEAYVRMRCDWRDDSEISHNEFVHYAFEYMEENPFLDDVVKLPTEAIMYDRVHGEITVWKRIRFTEFYWQPGEFWRGMKLSLELFIENNSQNPKRLINVLEYVGLLEPPCPDWL